MDRPVGSRGDGSGVIHILFVDSKSEYYKKREVGAALALRPPSQLEENRLTNDDSRLSDHTGAFSLVGSFQGHPDLAKSEEC